MPSKPGAASAASSRRDESVGSAIKVPWCTTRADAGHDLHRSHPAPPRAAQIDRQHEAAKDVVALGRNRERLGHLDHQVRLAQAPSVCKRRRAARGAAARSPDGAPAAAHCASTATSDGARRRSPSKWGGPGDGSQGGM